MKNRINELRRVEGLTWNALSEATGIAKPTLHRLAYGNMKTVRMAHVDALCTFFRLPIGELFQGEVVNIPLPKSPKLQERAKRAAKAKADK